MHQTPVRISCIRNVAKSGYWLIMYARPPVKKKARFRMNKLSLNIALR